MPCEQLVKLVQEFLDAEVFLEQRRIEDGDAGPQEKRFTDARERLTAALDQIPSTGDQPPIAAEARAYVEAVESFDRSRAEKKDLAAPARALERTQRELQNLIYGWTRHASVDRDVPLKRVLVAVDADDEADRALSTAIELAESLPARLKFIHVIPQVISDRWDDVYATFELYQTARQRAAELLRRMQDSLPAGIESETLVREGVVANDIVSAARRWGADFILMGTRGRGRIARFFLGSTAQAVIRMAPCPVITVANRPEKQESCEATGAGSQTHAVMRV